MMKPWWIRAIGNAFLGVLAGFVAMPVLMFFIGLGAVAFRGAPIDKFVDFLIDFVTKPRMLKFFLVIAFMGFVTGLSSTPIYKNPPVKTDKYKVLLIGAIFNTLIPPYLGTLISPTQSYFDCLALGLFIGLPLTIYASITLQDKALKKFMEKNDNINN